MNGANVIIDAKYVEDKLQAIERRGFEQVYSIKILNSKQYQMTKYKIQMQLNNFYVI